MIITIQGLYYWPNGGQRIKWSVSLYEYNNTKKYRDVSLLHSLQTGFGPHPASCLVVPGKFFLPVVDQLRHKAEHSPQPSDGVKNVRAIPSLLKSSWRLIN
jgi:hypothetical protein